MGDLARKYNMKSPAVKRLMREAAELSEPTDQYHAQPLEDNLFEWHFTVRGSPDTEFEEGKYHGRITLPPEYPMKPPSIILLTPNGRFEVGKKICLSMSAHHPETWQPSWSIRTVLLALIGFMPTPGGGAIGALDHTPEERKNLAKRSKNWKCESCNSDNGTCLLERDPTKGKEEAKEIQELVGQISFKGENKSKENKNSAPKLTPEAANHPPHQYQHQMPSIYGSFTNQNYGVPNNQIPPNLIPNPSSMTPPNPSQQQPESPVDSMQNQATSSSTEASNVSSETLTASNENDTTLRQRIRTEIESNEQDISLTSGEISPSSEHEQPTSRADRISLILTWVVSAILVVLIIRRLATEDSSTR